MRRLAASMLDEWGGYVMRLETLEWDLMHTLCTNFLQYTSSPSLEGCTSDGLLDQHIPLVRLQPHVLCPRLRNQGQDMGLHMANSATNGRIAMGRRKPWPGILESEDHRPPIASQSRYNLLPSRFRNQLQVWTLAPYGSPYG